MPIVPDEEGERVQPGGASSRVEFRSLDGPRLREGKSIVLGRLPR